MSDVTLAEVTSAVSAVSADAAAIQSILKAQAYIPAPASAVSFNTLFFLDDFSTDSIGTNWSITQAVLMTAFFSAMAAGVPGNPDPSWFTFGESILTILKNANNSQGTEVCSFIYDPATKSGTPLAPLIDASKGGYVEVMAQLPTTIDNNVGMPDFWMMDFTGIISQFSGTGSERYAEIDIYETWSGGWTQTYCEWNGWNNRTNGVRAIGGGPSGGFTPNDGKWHRWGVRWRTMAQNGGTGILEWFLDGQPYGGTPLTWTSASDVGGAIETAMFAIMFCAEITLPVNIDYVGVWQ
jgi:hypothetical protein